jgi:Lar family restriction alleviation protein
MAMRSCPFCGRVPHVRTYVSESLFNHNMVEWTEITCSTCDISMRSAEDQEPPTAIDVWNRRAVSKRCRNA